MGFRPSHHEQRFGLCMVTYERTSRPSHDQESKTMSFLCRKVVTCPAPTPFTTIAKAEKCILVSYSHAQKGYKCYNPQTREVRVIQDVIFDEEASWYSTIVGFDDEGNIDGLFEVGLDT